MQGREEKQLDASLEAIIQRIHDLRQSLISFICKLENEYNTLNWTTVLDNYALLSGQISLLGKFLKSDKMSHLKNYVAIPFSLSPELDPNLEKLTEGRVPYFNHEVVPNYLRTKPEPEIEDRLAQMQNKAHSLTAENLQKQTNTLNKLANLIQETLKNSKEMLDGDPVQKGMPLQTCTTADTTNLVAAMLTGKGLKPSSTSSMQQQQIGDVRSGSAGGGNSSVQQVMSNMTNMSKAPNPIKTNVKAAMISTQYNR
ncbi:hypothetical protein HELRODRAFT_185934 [Helobdella robusta]|uniref:Mediator of RNA polymerase II transcription subunit 8 n=1 Tax=Helobdella robusta TaxID=6412 RepID=T1FNG4_HELRO|nr:hypothetical protein HELRODRAFT_185934 [Helobdella robusta]ESN97269.1 hypothetical protein HELRODRAFT_185934 [Helobdella robusta]